LPRLFDFPKYVGPLWIKGYLDMYHYNFPKLEIYHYNSPILTYTIAIL
jgi:hypothetical protein